MKELGNGSMEADYLRYNSRYVMQYWVLLFTDWKLLHRFIILQSNKFTDNVCSIFVPNFDLQY